MMLAEALQERADLTRQINQLEQRITNNATHQEGVEPSEPPYELISQAERMLVRMEKLMTAINMTNIQTMVDGTPLMTLLVRRDVMRRRISILRNVADEAGDTWRRSRGDEIRVLPSVDVSALRRQLDELSREFRLLDNRIQAANWSTELVGL